MIPTDERGPIPGVYHGVPSLYYHALPLVSASRLKTAAKESLQEARLEMLRTSDTATAAIRQGIAIHAMILEGQEPKSLVTRRKGAKRSASPWLQSQARDQWKPLLDAADIEVVAAVENSWRTTPDAALFRGVLRSCPLRELTIIGEDQATGQRYKARVDALGDEIGADIKTGRIPSIQAMRRRMRENGDDLQAAFYWDAVPAAGLPDPKWWAILGVHTASIAPEYGTFTVSQEMRERVRPLIRVLLDRWALAEKTNRWPGRFGGAEIPLDHSSRDADDVDELVRLHRAALEEEMAA